MRLLEPINGVKVAQGNAMMHIVFFIAMFTIDSDISTNLRNNKETTLLETSEDQREIKEFELFIFKML
jgi:hypothetical protein